MKHPRRILSGILLMLYSSVAFSLMALCIKTLSRRSVPSQEIVFWRSLAGFLTTFIVIRRKRIPLFGNAWRPLVIRGVIGFISLALYIYAIAHLPLGTAVLLNYTSPVFTALMAIVFLKERPNTLLLCMTGVAFIGIYFLVDRPALTQDTAALLALLSAVTTAAAYISISAIKKSESPLTILFYFTGISTLGSLFFIGQGFIWPPGLTSWLIIAGIGVFSFYGQLWMTIALRRAPVSLLVPFSYLTPLLSFIYGFLFWQEHLSIKEVTGAAMIITAGVLISSLGQAHETRKT